VTTLLATTDGAIWAGFRYGGVARISQGRVKLFTEADGLPIVGVKHIRQVSDGGLWALRQQTNLIRFGADGAWHLEPTPLGEPGGLIHDIFIDSSDTLWLDQGGQLYRRALNQRSYSATAVQSDYPFGFAEAPDHSLWVNDSVTNASGHPIGRTQHIDRSGKLLARVPDTATLQDMICAPDGALVMAPTNAGIARLAAEQLTTAALTGPAPSQDIYTKKDGLSSDSLTVLLPDADGNLWAGGQRGLDRFRRARLVAFSPKYEPATTATGLGRTTNLCAGNDGAVWITGDHLEVFKSSGDTLEILHTTGQVHSMSCGPGNDAWLLASDGIFEVQGDRVTPVPPIPGVHPFDADQIVANRDHTLFASVSFGRPEVNGIWRHDRGGWTRITPVANPGLLPTVEYIDTRDRLWVGYLDGRLGLPLEQGEPLLSSGNPGLGVVFAVLETSHGLFAGGLNGVAVLRDGRFELLDFADRASSRGVGGIVESDNGDLWLNAQSGVVHVPAAELETALKKDRYAMRSELVVEGEFVGPVKLRDGKSTTARDSEGKLWFVTLNGVFHLDPGGLNYTSRPPKLSIESITADRKPVGAGSVGPESQLLEVQFLGVNLTAPERVTYKYRLDGFDEAWLDAGHRTEVSYRQLRPGRYVFRVMASNGDGIWTHPVSSAYFIVLPSLYQTTWFRVFCLAAALFLIGTLYQLRLHRLREHHDALNQARSELAHVARLATLSTMTASITHEVSQPISGILTNANTCARMLAADPPDVAGASETVRRTIRDADRATEVIKRLRAMFAKKAPTVELVDLNDVAREVIAMSAAELRRNRLSLQTDFAELLPAIRGDRVQLQQVVLNLLLNAADAMAGIQDRPRTLRVQTRIQDSGSVELLVRDSGSGIDARSVEKLFDAFHTTKAHGLGIGLAISRSIIESHQGELWATANDGPGATFGFSIPCARGTVAETADITTSEA
jgi:signal transduction histidine kinase/ligand-binding sensor domain-containing protein